MKSKLILIGGGGHCHACIDVIESGNQYEIIGLIDIKEKIGQKVLGYPIIGTDNEIIQFIEKDTFFLITLGHIKSADLRKKIFEILIELKANIATVISPFAVVSRHSKIGTGTIIMHQSTISAGAEIGENSIINTNANIEHDSKIGSNVHISTHAVINGNCEVADNCFVGSNSTLFQGVKIAQNVVVGAGSLISRDIIQAGVYYGNPFHKKQ